MNTALQHRKASAIARGFVIDAVDGRLDEAKRFLAAMESAIELGMSAGADASFLLDTAKGAHDAVSDLQGQMYRDLDAAGVTEGDAYLYMGELDELIVKLERDAALAAKRGIA